MANVNIAISNSNFGLGLKTAKRVGGKFNPATKTWSIPATATELNAPSMYAWRIIVNQPINPATTWVGQASMDAEDSIF